MHDLTDADRKWFLGSLGQFLCVQAAASCWGPSVADPAIGGVYEATDIPPVSSLSERRKLGLIPDCSVPKVCDLTSGSPQDRNGSARVEPSKVVFTTFNASRTPENLS
jgi:hypothetical protein